MKKVSKFYLVAIFIILYAPIIYLMIYAFNSGESMANFEGISFGHFQELFSDSSLMFVLVDTLLLAFISSLVATIIGLLGVLYIYRLPYHKSERWLRLNNILLVAPDVMIGASFLMLFTVIGFQLGFASVLLSHIAFSIPIVVLMLLPHFKEMNGTMLDAAYDLGATKFQAFHRILLPYLTPSLLSAFFMAFTYSLDDFAVTFFVTGNGFSTLSVAIYSRARRGISLELNALSTLVFLVSVLLVIGYYMTTYRKEEIL